ncbi:MAG: type I methionyl aminopeptidase [Caldisericia bacterium]|nr:type I methionyl aminopeptidase [Caldisericia bacterium]
MIILKSKEEIKRMKKAGHIIACTMQLLREAIKPGISTADLDKIAYEFILKNNAKPNFLGLYDYPATICSSLNDEVIHGIPDKKRFLKEGDILKIDMGCIWKGYHSDMARSFPVGDISKERQRLLNITEQSLTIAIKTANSNNTVGDIGSAVASFVEKNGYSVVKEYCGHGVGLQLHEEPQIPNYGVSGKGVLLREGMTVALEPMVNAGTCKVKTKPNGWTVVTADHKDSAHFENSIYIGPNGPEILTKIQGDCI